VIWERRYTGEEIYGRGYIQERIYTGEYEKDGSHPHQ
jgi:hypothetical protein